jgi:hypothetical protein
LLKKTEPNSRGSSVQSKAEMAIFIDFFTDLIF